MASSWSPACWIFCKIRSIISLHGIEVVSIFVISTIHYSMLFAAARHPVLSKFHAIKILSSKLHRFSSTTIPILSHPQYGLPMAAIIPQLMLDDSIHKKP